MNRRRSKLLSAFSLSLAMLLAAALAPLAAAESGLRPYRATYDSDYGDERHYETARFDWNDGRMEVLRKGKRWEVDLVDGVYDYQSIHLLASEMRRAQQKTSTVDFYRKGKLVKSRVVYSGRETVNLDGKKLDAEVFEQVVNRSSGKVKYFYDAENLLLPLRIERLKSGKSPTVMTLREVVWGF